MKRCSRCKQEKERGEFHRNRSRKDGLQHYCRECVREDRARRYAGNSEKEIAETLKRCSRCKQEKERGEFNRDRSRKDGLMCWCRECSREESAKYRVENPEKHRASQAKYLTENPENRRATVAKWAAENPEMVRAKNQRRRAIKHNATVPGELVTAEIRETIFDYNDGLCAYCRGPAEAIDHVMPLALGGLDHWTNLAPACTSCNSRKRDKHPEQWRKEIVA